MNETFSFGSYHPGDSVLHRLDPRTKLAGGIAMLVISLVARGFAGLAPVAVFVVLLYALARVPLGKAVRSVAPLLVIVALAALLNLFTNQQGATLASLGPLRISEGGAYAASFTACRLTLMMLAMSLVTLTTTTLDLTEGFERLLSPLARVGVPAHELGMVLGIALRFMPQLAREMTDVYRAQASRGATLAGGPLRGVGALSSVVVPLFAGVFRHAETLAAAMDARCYHGDAGRTRLHPLRLGRIDAVAGAALAVLLACVLVAGNLA